MARIVITGGTGFVGIHTTRALVEAGHDVRVLARGTRRPRKGVRLVRGDIGDVESLVTAFADCDVVVHLVAVIRERGRQTFRRVNVDGARNVAEAARRAGVQHLISVGGLGATPDPRYAFLYSKWQGEQLIRASGVPWTALRPSLLFGPGDGFFTQLARLVRLNPVVPVAGDGRTVFQPFAVADLAKVITLAVERGPANMAYDMGGPDHMTYDQIIDTIKTVLHKQRFIGILPRKSVHVPAGALMPAAWVFDKVFPKHPPVTVDQLRSLTLNNITQPNAVERDWGFQPLRFADNAEYLEDY